MTPAHRRAVREAIHGLCDPGERMVRIVRASIGPSDHFVARTRMRDGHGCVRIYGLDPERALFLLLWHMVGDRQGDPGHDHDHTPSVASRSATARKLDTDLRTAWHRAGCGHGHKPVRFPSAKRLRRDVRQIQADLAAYALKRAS